MRRHSFATLITHDGSSSFASHLPFLYNQIRGPYGCLTAHMARANPQWEHISNGQEALVIFQGPHAYISPSWYEAALAVPTWNYAVVHAYGVPNIITAHDRLVEILNETVATYESGMPQPWNGDLLAEFRDKLVDGIVGFEIPITRIEGKFKLGQNRTQADQQRVHDALAKSADGTDRSLAELMCEESEGRIEVRGCPN
jgi:transcriptional regulator